MEIAMVHLFGRALVISYNLFHSITSLSVMV